MMGREQLEALARIIQEQMALGPKSAITGSWSARWDKDEQAFYFDKCEWGGYCEERPSKISLTGEVLDPGGPLIRA